MNLENINVGLGRLLGGMMEPTIYSNCDHRLRESVIEGAKHTGKRYHHAAWNFSGHIHFDIERQIWVEEVWRHHHRVETLENKNLQELISHVNKKYGYD